MLHACLATGHHYIAREVVADHAVHASKVTQQDTAVGIQASGVLAPTQQA